MTTINLTGDTSNKIATVVKKIVLDENNKPVIEGLVKTSEGEITKQDTNMGELLSEYGKVDNGSQKQVVTDGPLSAIYAQALNIAYAKESVADGSQLTIIPNEVLSDPALSKPDIYIYATSEDEIEKEGISDIFDHIRVALDHYKDSVKIIVIESLVNRKITSKVAALEEYASSADVKLSYNRDIAVNKIINVLNK